jgi:hypothetical protein
MMPGHYKTAKNTFLESASTEYNSEKEDFE